MSLPQKLQRVMCLRRRHFDPDCRFAMTHLSGPGNRLKYRSSTFPPGEVKVGSLGQKVLGHNTLLQNVHDRPESLFTTNRNRCSRYAGMTVHGRPEYPRCATAVAFVNLGHRWISVRCSCCAPGRRHFNALWPRWPYHRFSCGPIHRSCVLSWG